MASIDHDRKRISAAILLFGPPGAGKTTALYALARQLPDGTHGKVAPLNQGDGRLLRLDYRPHDQELVYGYQVNFRLVGCPGSIEVDLIRPVLGAVDAVLFVADSSKTALKANVKALELLDRMVRPTGRTLADLPMVFLYNKRDLRDALEIRLLEQKLNRFGCNYVAASAVRGQGVMDALQRLTASVAVQVRQQVQSAGGTPGSAPGNTRTVAHGTTLQQARAVQAGSDDHTAISHEAEEDAVAAARWEGDDDRTELNPAEEPAADWSVEVAEPGDFTRPSGPPPEAGSGDWTRPSPGQERSPAAAFASATSSFRELTPLEPEAPAPRSTRGRSPEPLKSADRWRTPAAFVEDMDSDDHTAPFRERGGFGQSDSAPSPEDITETGLVTSSPPASVRRSPPPPSAQAGAAAAASPRAQVGRPMASPKARRIERPHTPPVAAAAAGGQQRVDTTQEGGPLDFTATQVINSLGRQPEAWESGIEGSAHRMKVPVPDLAGYVVSRIGTPKASTRRTIQVPVRATHMDTLMPQDFVLDIEFRGGPGGRESASPAVSARRQSSTPDGKTVPLSWVVGLFGVSIVAIAVIIALFVSKLA